MFRLNKITNYQVTRSLIFHSLTTGKDYDVFDDSDLLGENEFAFLSVGEEYECKFCVYGELNETGNWYDVVGFEYVGEVLMVKLKNTSGDFVYYSKIDGIKLGTKVKIKERRLDLIAVNEIIYQPVI